MTSLIGLFKTAPEESQDSDKLLDLYWNRAGLKKEFAALRDEKYQLQDRIKQHQGATAREQQKLEHLENLLLDREWVHNVVVFYQLRRLAMHCSAKIERFAEQLKQQREKKIHSRAMASWNEERSQNAARIERKIGEHRLQSQLLEDRLQSERHKLLTMNGFVKLFRGRRLAAAINEIADQIEASQVQEQKLLAALNDNQNLSPPDHEGLNIAAKRSINTMIISFVQQLFLCFEEDNLAALAKEAGEKSAGAVNYGTKFDCDQLLRLIDQRWDTMETVSDHAEILQKRAALIAEGARYRDSEDAVPQTDSVANVYAIDGNGTVQQVDCNVLGENYFGVARFLSR